MKFYFRWKAVPCRNIKISAPHVHRANLLYVRVRKAVATSRKVLYFSSVQYKEESECNKCSCVMLTGMEGLITGDDQAWIYANGKYLGNDNGRWDVPVR